jgi:hypothetical protein
LKRRRKKGKAQKNSTQEDVGLNMNLIENAEKECVVLGSLFQGIVNDMKVSDNKSLVPILIY